MLFLFALYSVSGCAMERFVSVLHDLFALLDGFLSSPEG
jgi:hypothetical protein